MTAQRDPDTGTLLAIVCDEIGCFTKAPDDDTLIMKHQGLRGLGWYCSGGKHLCPVHNVTGDG